MKELLRYKLPHKEYVAPGTDLKVISGEHTLVSHNLGDTVWAFNEIVIVETEFEGRRALGVLMVES